MRLYPHNFYLVNKQGTFSSLPSNLIIDDRIQNNIDNTNKMEKFFKDGHFRRAKGKKLRLCSVPNEEQPVMNLHKISRYVKGFC